MAGISGVAAVDVCRIHRPARQPGTYVDSLPWILPTVSTRRCTFRDVLYTFWDAIR
jgi:hypothetical protein